MTGIVVTHNTKELFQKAFESVRKCHHYLPIIVIEGSDQGDECRNYAKSLRDDITDVYEINENIGHGKGMHLGLLKCQDSEAVIFDSDIVMKHSPIPEMMALLDSETYGVGWLTEVGRDGFDFGTYPVHYNEAPIPYLHPYFMLLNVKEYFKYSPFVHHGAPCYKSMIDLKDRGHSYKLKHFNGLTGHTKGHGINWTGKDNYYIQHDFGGTRMENKRRGTKEIPGQWQR